MSLPPPRPKIYHITHVDNLPEIVRAGGLYCDATRIGEGRNNTTIGMASIKSRRLRLPVPCHPSTRVGEYVPFYFCPRSIMLYVIHQANHQELVFRGGQARIVHLEADLFEVVEWASSAGRPWAFSLSNAGSRYARILSSIDDLDKLNWEAIEATDFRDPDIKEGKQAEFLIHEWFPWELITRIGTHSERVKNITIGSLGSPAHHPKVSVEAKWYY